jgi:hypothetical protein
VTDSSDWRLYLAEAGDVVDEPDGMPDYFEVAGCSGTVTIHGLHADTDYRVGALAFPDFLQASAPRQTGLLVSDIETVDFTTAP